MKYAEFDTTQRENWFARMLRDEGKRLPELSHLIKPGWVIDGEFISRNIHLLRPKIPVLSMKPGPQEFDRPLNIAAAMVERELRRQAHDAAGRLVCVPGISDSRSEWSYGLARISHDFHSRPEFLVPQFDLAVRNGEHVIAQSIYVAYLIQTGERIGSRLTIPDTVPV